MLFESRCFWYPKDLEYSDRYEDSFRVDGEGGVVAIADGVSSAMFSKQWANILTQGVVENTPPIDDVEALSGWLCDLRSLWTKSFDFSNLDFFQRQKLERVGGGYSTLLWLKLSPVVESTEQPGVRYLLRAWGVGDCCLFLVRDGHAVTKFPLEVTSDFERDPISICSANLNHHDAVVFCSTDMCCQSGDLVVLATDAIAKWIYQQLELSEPIDWENLWQMQSHDWSQRIRALRDLPQDHRMRVDDTTIVMLRMALRETLTISDDGTSGSTHALVISPIDEDMTQPDAAEAVDHSDVETHRLEIDSQATDVTAVEDIALSDELPASVPCGTDEVKIKEGPIDALLDDRSHVPPPLEPE